MPMLLHMLCSDMPPALIDTVLHRIAQQTYGRGRGFATPQVRAVSGTSCSCTAMFGPVHFYRVLCFQRQPGLMITS